MQKHRESEVLGKPNPIKCQ